MKFYIMNFQWKIFSNFIQNRTTEKDKYIAQLLRERELERAQVTRAATQAEEAEKKLYSLKTEYDRVSTNKINF